MQSMPPSGIVFLTLSFHPAYSIVTSQKTAKEFSKKH
jgi:hypothetical protein